MSLERKNFERKPTTRVEKIHGLESFETIQPPLSGEGIKDFFLEKNARRKNIRAPIAIQNEQGDSRGKRALQGIGLILLWAASALVSVSAIGVGIIGILGFPFPWPDLFNLVILGVGGVGLILTIIAPDVFD